MTLFDTGHHNFFAAETLTFPSIENKTLKNKLFSSSFVINPRLIIIFTRSTRTFIRNNIFSEVNFVVACTKIFFFPFFREIEVPVSFIAYFSRGVGNSSAASSRA